MPIPLFLSHLILVKFKPHDGEYSFNRIRSGFIDFASATDLRPPRVNSPVTSEPVSSITPTLLFIISQAEHKSVALGLGVFIEPNCSGQNGMTVSSTPASKSGFDLPSYRVSIPSRHAETIIILII